MKLSLDIFMYSKSEANILEYVLKVGGEAS